MHVIYSMDIGGLENGIVNLINGMDEGKYYHSICCIDRSGRSAERLKRKDLEIVEINKGEERDMLLSLRLAHVFKGRKIDIVHTRNWGAIDGIIGAKLAGVPVILHGEHGRDMTDPEGSNGKRRLIRKGLSYFTDRYITVSKDLQEWLITAVGINEKKVQTICNGVDIDKFNPDNKSSLRAEYGYLNEDIVIGTVGRLDPVKDQQLLIKTFAQLDQKYHNLRLLIVGDGPSRNNLEELSKDMGLQKSVFFLGMRTDVPELLKLLDIFVLPSIAEGISNTILEAMATGLPVIATCVGGNKELVVDGVTGYLVPREDIATLVNALERYILNRSLMKQHGAAGRESVLKNYSLEQMVAQYETLYTNMVSRKYSRVMTG